MPPSGAVIQSQSQHNQPRQVGRAIFSRGRRAGSTVGVGPNHVAPKTAHKKKPRREGHGPGLLILKRTFCLMGHRRLGGRPTDAN